MNTQTTPDHLRALRIQYGGGTATVSLSLMLEILALRVEDADAALEEADLLALHSALIGLESRARTTLEDFEAYYGDEIDALQAQATQS